MTIKSIKCLKFIIQYNQKPFTKLFVIQIQLLKKRLTKKIIINSRLSISSSNIIFTHLRIKSGIIWSKQLVCQAITKDFYCVCVYNVKHTNGNNNKIFHPSFDLRSMKAGRKFLTIFNNAIHQFRAGNQTHQTFLILGYVGSLPRFVYAYQLRKQAHFQLLQTHKLFKVGNEMRINSSPYRWQQKKSEVGLGERGERREQRTRCLVAEDRVVCFKDR